jgi:hypothetical protein
MLSLFLGMAGMVTEGLAFRSPSVGSEGVRYAFASNYSRQEKRLKLSTDRDVLFGLELPTPAFACSIGLRAPAGVDNS